MRKILPFFAPLGLALMAGSWVYTLLPGRTLPGNLGSWLVGGFALVLLHVVLAWEDIDRAIGRRQLKYGANMVILALVFLAILVALNWIVYGNSKRWDLTKQKKFTLSEQALKVLGGLKDDVRILYFQTRGQLAQPGSDAQQNMRKFEEVSKRVKVEFVDPAADPGQALKYEISSVPTLVLVRGERHEKIFGDSEQDLTNGLIKVTREGHKTVCFLEGEGERGFEDFSPRGYSKFKAGLESNQYKTRKLSLLSEAHVPAECTALVLAGAQKDPAEGAIEALRSYVSGGGRLLVLAEPQLKEPFPRFEALLSGWNIKLGGDVVMYPSRVQAAFGRYVALAQDYPYHEITKDMKQFATAFPLARSVEPGTATAPGVNVQPLVKTDELAYGENDFTPEGLQRADASPEERKGPFTLGVVATVEVKKPAAPAPAGSPAPGASPSPEPEAPKAEGRVIVFGSADLASNTGIDLPVVANSDLALNATAWLVQDSDLITIRPRDPEDQRLAMAGGTRMLWLLFSLIVLPGACIVAGVVSWWRRRG